jgi:hypothetical protein
LREEGLAMIVMPASSLDGRFAGASTAIDARAHPNNTKRLLTKASRLKNQKVSRATLWDGQLELQTLQRHCTASGIIPPISSRPQMIQS